jgi:hypothetical protein
LLASVSTLVLLALICLYVSTAVLRLLAPSLGLSALALLVTAGVLLTRASRQPSPDPSPVDVPPGDVPGEDAQAEGAQAEGSRSARPFALGPAVLLAAVLTGALLLGRWGSDAFGAAGAVAVSGLAGLADAHAGALAAAQLAAAGQIPATTAALAVTAALATNTALKVLLAFAAGGLAVGLRYTALMVAPIVAFAAPVILAAR